MTGWRVGWAIAPPALTNAIRKVHDFLTVGAAAPLQAAGAMALDVPDEYFQKLAEGYRTRRDLLLPILREAGLKPSTPQGAYYIICDVSGFNYRNDVEFTQFLVQEIGVAVVPGSSFYSDPANGVHQVRFAFCKKEATLIAAGERISRLKTLASR